MPVQGLGDRGDGLGGERFGEVHAVDVGADVTGPARRSGGHGRRSRGAGLRRPGSWPSAARTWEQASCLPTARGAMSCRDVEETPSECRSSAPAGRTKSQRVLVDRRENRRARRHRERVRTEGADRTTSPAPSRSRVNSGSSCGRWRVTASVSTRASGRSTSSIGRTARARNRSRARHSSTARASPSPAARSRSGRSERGMIPSATARRATARSETVACKQPLRPHGHDSADSGTGRCATPPAP